ncbi:hypothetical protein [Salinarimonas chemoclinalis]|uniref:hypothetical protein n=1 Tax=Salinarimonas chemoclinalis TaxID=3241599 RepID=UPI00355811E0
MRIIPAPPKAGRPARKTSPKPSPNASAEPRPGAPRTRRETVPVPTDLRDRALAFDMGYEEALEASVARAEAAEARVRAHAGDVLAMEAARCAGVADGFAPGDAACRARCLRAAHRLRGTALGVAAPQVARMAASLARLLSGAGNRTPAALVAAHVDAVQAATDGKANAHAAETLARELEAAVETVLSRLR